MIPTEQLKKIKDLAAKRLELLNITISENVLNYTALEMVQHVLNFCNREDIPQQLEYIIAKMIGDYVISNYTDQANEDAKSIKVGDTTIQFESNSTNAIVVSFMDDYKSDLYRFRKLEW